MARPRNIHAIATKASIASLYAMAESRGFVQIRVKSEADCYNIRNRLYAHRAALRKTAHAVTGIAGSSLDSFKFSWEPEYAEETGETDFGGPRPTTGNYIFTIDSEGATVEFDLLIPEWDHDPIPDFDTPIIDPDEFIDPPPQILDDEIPF